MKFGRDSIREIMTGLKTREGRHGLYAKYREIIMYVVFGVLTTIISFASYYAARWVFPDAQSVPGWLRWIFNITSVFGTDSATALPVIISWILSVTFAFVTNRTVVFRSSEKGAAGVFREAVSFYAARLATLFVDLVIMFLLVDLTGIQNSWYELGCKLFSNVVILVLNYILSKLLVFRKKKSDERTKD